MSATSDSCEMRTSGVPISVEMLGAKASGGVRAVSAGSGASSLKQTEQRARVEARASGPQTEQ